MNFVYSTDFNPKLEYNAPVEVSCYQMPQVKNRTNLSEKDFESISSELKQHQSLQDLLRWAQSQPEGALIPGAISELVVQDEFTHDLVVPWRNWFIVYGTT
ncbi:MAG TPA: hypothetical protein VH815_03650 [Acidobacteriota bacterium]